VFFSGTISTEGEDSDAVLVQGTGGYSGDADASDGTSTYGAGDESGGKTGSVTVTLDSDGSYITSGDSSDGVAVQSVGAGGGKGGSASGISALGGKGSSGGDAGEVTLTIGDGTTVSTSGEFSGGIFAQSKGGGGGSGGGSVGISSIGGSAGNGGAGSDVNVTLGAITVETTGEKSDGVYVSSSGGGGGKAQSTVGVSALGGSGGSGGAGAAVNVALNGTTVSTGDDRSKGVVLQSIGGGGGSASSTVALGVDYSSAIGGTGGSAHAGGDVQLTSDSATIGSITTVGDHSDGLVAQSIGGGGGNSSDVYSFTAGVGVSVGIGQVSGSGAGGAGGSVTIEETYFTIETSGDHSHGIHAQSVDGAGGATGSTIDYADSTEDTVDVEWNVGSSAGSGGSAGAVTVAVNNSIQTSGDRSKAVSAQSIGGGGGDSGSTLTGSANSLAVLSNTVGGSGGTASAGGAVSVSVSADLTTSGDHSDGIHAQSVGGGGGSSGWVANVDGLSEGNISSTTGGDGGKGGDASTVDVTFDSDNLNTGGDLALGIKAQSVGGSGGDSGYTIAGDLASSVNIGLTTGGSGGASGDSDDVTVTSNGAIVTEGAAAIGILAQSISTSGGHSGMTINADALNLGDVSLTSEGNGGDGGSSGDVELDIAGSVTTSGNKASALVAQSIAGGGGSAIGVISVEVLAMESIAGTIGGSGGSGGPAGTVTVKNEADLSTDGTHSHGILAQSLGGDGGNGGFTVGAGLTAGEYTADLSAEVGGSGGDGGTAGTVEVVNTGLIATTDFKARGIKAQSIGGSGGDAGAVVGGFLGASTEGSLDVNVEVGGDGGAGGISGDVTVNNFNDITTSGHYAQAILGQSIGGNGGTGGSTYAFTGDASSESSLTADITVGGSGGSADDGDEPEAGNVTIENFGALTTQQHGSTAIQAQSIGGSGGDGGSSGTVLWDLTSGSSDSSTYSAALSITVGGEGGVGGTAGEVVVDNYAPLATSGHGAKGIYAQSVGGNGGDGGLASSYIQNGFESDSSGSNNYSLTGNLSIGGDGSAGGDADSVTVTNTDTIATAGTAAYAIYAHSIGGGGGGGGDGDISSDGFVDAINDAIALGQSGDETGAEEQIEAAFEEYVVIDDDYQEYFGDWIDAIDDLYETGTDFTSYLTTYEIAIGGQGGASGDGDAITITNSGDIATTGDSATALRAHSVGGGGGSGGAATGGFVSKIVVGGTGSGGGNGGTVSIDNTGNLFTTGDKAMGIYAQSVGGGGGSGGDPESALGSNFDNTDIGAGVIVGGEAGDGGDGGDITIISGGNITTTGEDSHGIWAHSVGGSGGAAGSSSLTFIGNNGDTGAAGNVEITVNAPIALSGDYGVGIFGQSVAGSDNAGGTVKVTLNADVTSTGVDSRGVIVQSDGGDSGQDMTIAVGDGVTLSTGSETNESKEAIYAVSGGGLTVENEGTIRNYQGLSTDVSNSNAIYSKADTNTINNLGTIQGSISLVNSGSNTFDNEIDALFEMGETVKIGDSGTLSNSGTLSPGGEDNIIDTTLTGSLTQTSLGTYQVDLSMGDGTTTADADQILGVDVSVTMAGSVSVNASGESLLISGESGSTFILQTANTTITSFSATATDTAVVDYSVTSTTNSGSVEISGTSYTGAGAVELSYSVDYSAGDSLFGNSAVFGAFMDDIVNYTRDNLSDGSAAKAAVVDLTNFVLNVPDVATLNDVYGSLVVDEAAASVVNAVSSALATQNLLQSCPVLEQDPNSGFYRQRECTWSQVIGSYSSQDQTSNNPGYDAHTYGMAVGAQREVQDDLFLEVVGSYETVDLDGPNFSQDGYQVGVGAALKKEFGPFLLSASANFGGYSFDHGRSYETNSGQHLASGDIRGHFIGGELRAYSVHLKNDLYVKPSAAVSVVQTWQDSFSETGAGGLEWSVDPISKTSVVVRPSLELGAAFDIAGQPATAFVRGGLTAYLSDPNTTATSYLADDAFSGLTGIETTLSEDRYIGELDVGVNVDLTDRLSLSVLGQASFSETAYSAGGFARLKIQF